jgi:hypothetical protein
MQPSFLFEVDCELHSLGSGKLPTEESSVSINVVDGMKRHGGRSIYDSSNNAHDHQTLNDLPKGSRL